jgi:cytochrome c oxidase subunit 3
LEVPDQHGAHLPSPSWWPVVVAAGLTIAAFGSVTHAAVFFIGVVIILVGSFRFALEHHDDPQHVHQDGALDVDHRKLAMWTLLASECFFFATLIGTYVAYKGRSVIGPYPHDVLNLPLTTLSTFDLLMSSLLMVLAFAAIQRGDHFHSRLWLAGTALFGMIFLGFQAYEFTAFVDQGLTLQQNLFGSTFFVLTGLHGGHVALGVLWLLSLLILDVRGRLRVQDSVKVEIAALYWHFVDVVWIVIFTLVYLVP